MKDLNQIFCEPMKIGEVIKDFVTDKYELPLSEIPYWIENGWKFDEMQSIMYKKGREAVNVQQFKTNQL
jgi:hypothetical protein